MPESTAAVELPSAGPDPDPDRSGPTLDELLARCTPEAVGRLMRRVGLAGEGPGLMPVMRFSSAI
ncbi:hypothetical protein [Kitasatospora sp. SUK 42]|uniref:hypothetical protein n=1 Tax=Kitasatospora sp. SUK 42 TaxID=1588882 RepID=UPI0018C93953|nr:hypothetical protein [Kitasatospora sp. SUK 42]MBV2152463.1 hypothetical protein [Kitasatospora sp. SUK 42]